MVRAAGSIALDGYPAEEAVSDQRSRVDFFMPLYVRDFLAATIGWTACEKGHYLTLLMLQWDRGGLPCELAMLERLSPGVGECWLLLEEKFPVAEDGMRRNARLEEHRAKALELRQKRAQAGAKGGSSKARATLKQGYSVAAAKTCHPEPEPEPPASSDDDADGATSSLTAAPAARSSGGRRRQLRRGLWSEFVAAWNAGPGAQWTAHRPPAEAIDRLHDEAWVETAMKAIPRLSRCRFFLEPVDLVQFCGEGFVEKVLGGRFDKRFKSNGAECRVARHDFGGTLMTDAEYAREVRRVKMLRDHEEAKRQADADWREERRLCATGEGGGR